MYIYTYLSGYGLDVLDSNPGRSWDWLWGLSKSLVTRIPESVSLGGNSRDIKMFVHFVELGQRLRGVYVHGSFVYLLLVFEGIL